MKRLFLALTLLLTFSLQAKEETTQEKISEDLAFEIQEKIVYHTVGKTKVLLDAFVPKKKGVYPAVIVIHGGSWRHGSRKSLRSYATALTKMGFVCFCIDYRLAPKHLFPAQIEDCQAAVVWVRKNAKKYKVDPEKIGAIGYSAGGHLTALLATSGEAPSKKNGNRDTRIQAAAAGGAPTEFRTGTGDWAKFWMGGNRASEPEKFKNASPTVFVDKNDPPTFFFNGTKDTVVPLKWTLPLYEALKKVGVKTELYKVEGAGHGAAARDPKAKQKAFAFLKSILKE